MACLRRTCDLQLLALCQKLLEVSHLALTLTPTPTSGPPGGCHHRCRPLLELCQLGACGAVGGASAQRGHCLRPLARGLRPLLQQRELREAYRQAIGLCQERIQFLQAQKQSTGEGQAQGSGVSTMGG